MHHKSCSSQDFFQIAFVPAGIEAFVFDADLPCGLVLQQTQRGAAEDAEVRIGVAQADPALVFLKRDIQLPMQTVLDAPMAADRIRESPRRDVLAKDVVSNFRAVRAFTARQ